MRLIEVWYSFCSNSSRVERLIQLDGKRTFILPKKKKNPVNSKPWGSSKKSCPLPRPAHSVKAWRAQPESSKGLSLYQLCYQWAIRYFRNYLTRLIIFRCTVLCMYHVPCSIYSRSQISNWNPSHPHTLTLPLTLPPSIENPSATPSSPPPSSS